MPSPRACKLHEAASAACPHAAPLPARLKDGWRDVGQQPLRLLPLQLVRQADKAVAATRRWRRLQAAREGRRGVVVMRVAVQRQRCGSGAWRLLGLPGLPTSPGHCRLTCPGATTLTDVLGAGRRCAMASAGLAPRRSAPDGTRSSGEVERSALGSGAYPSCLAFFMAAPLLPLLGRAER